MSSFCGLWYSINGCWVKWKVYFFHFNGYCKMTFQRICSSLQFSPAFFPNTKCYAFLKKYYCQWVYVFLSYSLRFQNKKIRKNEFLSLPYISLWNQKSCKNSKWNKKHLIHTWPHFFIHTQLTLLSNRNLLAMSGPHLHLIPFPPTCNTYTCVPYSLRCVWSFYTWCPVSFFFFLSKLCFSLQIPSKHGYIVEIYF